MNSRIIIPFACGGMTGATVSWTVAELIKKGTAKAARVPTNAGSFGASRRIPLEASPPRP